MVVRVAGMNPGYVKPMLSARAIASDIPLEYISSKIVDVNDGEHAHIWGFPSLSIKKPGLMMIH